MVLNAAVQMLREAEDLKQKILKFKSGTSMLQDRTLWVTQQELQKIYQKVLVLDLDYALDKKVEQDLWNVGFKQQIEALQAISKDRKSPARSEAQATLAWVLQAAAGFYLCLLHQICTTFRLDLPFRRRASLMGGVAGWGAARAGGAAAARYCAQHCLVHLGDLARYRHQVTTAHTFYRHALLVSAHSGQPYNQLALLATRRGRALPALYYHARSLLVRSPFPPARANLARTLRAQACDRDLPVLAGGSPRASPAPPPPPADARAHVTQLLQALHLLHAVQDTETAEQMVVNLNASVAALVAAGQLDATTLIQMLVVLIWLVHWATDDGAAAAGALSAGEAAAARGGLALAAGAQLALLLSDDERLLAPLKVCLQWQSCSPALLAWRGLRAPRLWAALARRLNALAAAHDAHAAFDALPYESWALPEDVELHGFLPLERALAPLDTPCAACAPPASAGDSAGEPAPRSVSPELEARLRAHRLLQLGRRLAELGPDLLVVSEDPTLHFSAAAPEGEAELAAALETLTAPAAPAPTPAPAAPAPAPAPGEGPPRSPPPPLVISEADFREKVREKRVGILKPQGSLERSREERAAVGTQDDKQDSSTSDEAPREDPRREARKARTNVAMAAILRKQEEGNKQVKFVTPPPTPDAAADKEPDKKLLQPKARLGQPGRTGGILALKDKSGYPHLVNAEPEPAKTDESQPQTSQNYKEGQWQAPGFNEPPRFAHKNAYAQNSGGNYAPNYQSNQGIRLPVVNPKEIDVRSAALQRQSARPDAYADAHKFGHMSGDKKNFLSDLPPRFANQFRQWQGAPDLQYTPDNKFRDDSFKSNAFSAPPPRAQPWANPPEAYPGWWKPEPGAYAVTPPSYYYQSPYKPELPTFVPSAPPPLASFGSPMSGFGSYAAPVGPRPAGLGAPAAGYDSSMYPQFNKMGYQGFKPPEKPAGQFGDADGGAFPAPAPDARLAFDPLRQDSHAGFDAVGGGRGADAGSTYSLFSSSLPPPWPPARQQSIQSLWSGPSPLERLLEQRPPGEPQ